MQREFFGTDGIRGPVGQGKMNPQWVMALAWSIGRSLTQSQPSRPTVLLGQDTRASGPMFTAALQAGFNAAGVDVFLAGVLPTPAIAYLSRSLSLSAGLAITASHNPHQDNGLKLFMDGQKLSDAQELAIEAQMRLALSQGWQAVPSAQLGRVARLEDARGRYIEFCKSFWPSDLSLKGLRLVVDCAHGAASGLAERVLRELGAEVMAPFSEPNGANINFHCGATAPQALQTQVIQQQADLGLAFDGDADRLLMVSSTGQILDGDHLLYLLVQASLAQGQQVPGVVGTLMTNMGLQARLQQLGIELVRAPVGDRYVKQELLRLGWQLGGENSGHLLNLAKVQTGDAIIAALCILQHLQRSGQSLAEASNSLQLWPQVLINLPWQQAQVQDCPDLQEAVNDVEQALAGRGRLLLRKSGTEPLLRVMVEAECEQLAKRLAKQLADQLRAWQQQLERPEQTKVES